MNQRVFLERKIRFLIEQGQVGRLSDALAAFFEVKRFENGGEEIILLEELTEIPEESIAIPIDYSASTIDTSGSNISNFDKLNA